MKKKLGLPVFVFPPFIAHNANSRVRNDHQVNNAAIETLCRAFTHLLHGLITN